MTKNIKYVIFVFKNIKNSIFVSKNCNISRQIEISCVSEKTLSSIGGYKVFCGNIIVEFLHLKVNFREIPSHVLQKVCMYFTYKTR